MKTMTWQCKRLVTASAMAGLSAAAFGDDLTITEAGTRTLDVPATYGALVNQVSSGDVVFSQAEPDESAALSFTSFDAVGGARTSFSKGWWSWGGGVFTD